MKDAEQRNWELAEARYEEIRALQERQRRVLAARETFDRLMDEIEALDPQGWSEWYNNNDNIPATLDWLNIEPVFAKMRARIDELVEQRR